MAPAPVLTPQAQDFPRWYQDVIAKAELADNGPVRGTMVIRPWGYALWERMQREVDDRIKAAGNHPVRRVAVSQSSRRGVTDHVAYSPGEQDGGQDAVAPAVAPSSAGLM